MAVRISTLAIISDKYEAEQVLLKLAGEIDYMIIALWPEAENYITERLSGWENPLYELVGTNGFKSSRYIFKNFKIAHKWARETEYKYIRDKIGYFLTEFDRSYDFANKVINKFMPRKLILGSLKNFVGSSVIFGTLKTNAFYLIAKEKKIPFLLLKSKAEATPIRQSVGQLFQFIRRLSTQTLASECDLLVLATARQLCQMENFVKDLSESGLVVKYLTYNLTLDYKRRLVFLGEYLEKERLIDKNLRSAAFNFYKDFLSKKLWNNFKHTKYNRGLALRYLKDKIKSDSHGEMRSVFLDIALADKVFEKLKPKALITLTDPDTKVLPYINQAKKLGIKTICIQHGAIYPFDSPAIFPVSEFFLVWSQLSKERLLKNSYFKKLKILVGQSPFHIMKKYVRVKSRKKLDVLYLNTAQLVDQAIINYYLKCLFDCISRYEHDINFFVRLHPNQIQFSSNIDGLAKGRKYKIIWSNKERLENLLQKVDLVIYENTTAGFDAMLASKPTIYFNPYTGEDFFNVTEHDASLSILSEQDIRSKLVKFIVSRDIQDKISKKGKFFAIKYLGLDEHRKVDRAVQAIQKICQKNV